MGTRISFVGLAPCLSLSLILLFGSRNLTSSGQSRGFLSHIPFTENHSNKHSHSLIHKLQLDDTAVQITCCIINVIESIHHSRERPLEPCQVNFNYRLTNPCYSYWLKCHVTCHCHYNNTELTELSA